LQDFTKAQFYQNARKEDPVNIYKLRACDRLPEHLTHRSYQEEYLQDVLKEVANQTLARFGQGWPGD